jgi:DNA modification methylase
MKALIRSLNCRDAFAYLKSLPDDSVDAIITDPPYDLPFLPLEDLWRVCSGNIIAFCRPENQWGEADEYHFWIKTPSTKNFQSKCGRFVEMILVYRKGNTFNNDLHWSQMIGIHDDRLITKTVHPYEKPVSLMERLIRIYTNPGDIVLDCFMGSGSTGVACVNTERGFVGVENSRVYFDIARKRIAKRSVER